jgi:predicted enzyme related to lactoylglutathione lyase
LRAERHQIAGRPVHVARALEALRIMSTVKSAAVLYVKDLDRMQSFYRACFGMNAADCADDYCVLESGSLTLSLVKTPDRIAATIALTEPPLRRQHVPIKLAFAVDSIETVRPLFVELGGLVDPPETQWTFRGGIHCDGVDPEGNVVQLLQVISHPVSREDQPALDEVAGQVRGEG